MNALTRSERTLIDQFIAEKGVTKVPTGKSAFNVEYIWDGYKLVSKEPESVVQRQNRFMKRNRRARPVDPTSGTIRDLFAKGHTDAQIGDVLGISAEAVKKRRHYMKLTGKPPASPEERAKRLETILAMKAQGETQAAIATALGVSQSTVSDMLQQHKNNGAGKQQGADYEQARKKAERRSQAAKRPTFSQQGGEGTRRASGF